MGGSYGAGGPNMGYNKKNIMPKQLSGGRGTTFFLPETVFSEKNIKYYIIVFFYSKLLKFV